jgi:putative spermidine/putrescine transport system ATP-binding protein
MQNSDVEVVLKNVTKKFGDFEAVMDFNLEIKKGEYITFLGPSGCGKTTTLRMIAGHEEPTSGDIFIRGKRVNELSPVERGTTMMFQDYALFPHRDIYQNVDFGLKMQKIPLPERKERVKSMLQRIGLEEFQHRRPHEISGGQQQRVALGRSLVTEPHVLLLDEPMGALDQLLRIQMRGELKLLQRSLGLTFIHVTHNQDECLSMGDTLVVMSDGVIEQIGTPHQIYCEPETLFVAEFVGENNIFRGEIDSVDGNKAVVKCNLGKFVVETDRKIPEPGVKAAFSIRADRATTLWPTEIPKDDGKNYLQGKVLFVEYYGFYTNIRIKLDNGTEFHIKEVEEAYLKTPVKEGDDVMVRWSFGDAVLLPDDGKSKRLYL